MGPKRVAAVSMALALSVVGCAPAAPEGQTAPVTTGATTSGSTGPEGSPGDAPADSPAATPSGSGGEAVIVPGLTAPAAFQLAPLGSVRYNVDTARTATVDYPADGTEVTLRLVDGSGITWTLVIPGDALATPQAISMTGLEDLTSTDIPARLAGGIQLEPDGLEFVVPARLTATGGSTSTTDFLLTGGHDGADMRFAPPVADPGGGARIFHFSSAIDAQAGAGDPLLSPAATARLTADEEAAMAAARAALKVKGIPTPEPPSVPLGCSSKDDSTANAAAKAAFLDAVLKPEGPLIDSLVTVDEEWQLRGRSDDRFEELEGELYARLEQKALLLMKTYKGKPEKVEAVSAAVTAIAHDTAFNGAGSTKTVDGLSGFWAAAIDPLIKDLIEKHDYAKAVSVVTLTRKATLAGESASTEATLRKLEGAQTFSLDAKLTVIFPDETWELSSTLTMAALGLGKDDLNGTGSGSYGAFLSVEGATMTAPGFPVVAALRNLNVCAGTAEFAVDRFFGETETYTIPNDDTSPHTFSLVKDSFQRNFAKYLKKGLYVFPVAVHNLDATMVNETIDVTSGSGTVQTTFDIVLSHTPKRVK